MTDLETNVIVGSIVHISLGRYDGRKMSVRPFEEKIPSAGRLLSCVRQGNEGSLGSRSIHTTVQRGGAISAGCNCGMMDELEGIGDSEDEPSTDKSDEDEDFFLSLDGPHL